MAIMSWIERLEVMGAWWKMFSSAFGRCSGRDEEEGSDGDIDLRIRLARRQVQHGDDNFEIADRRRHIANPPFPPRNTPALHTSDDGTRDLGA
jgi:hypothetical protein